MRYLVTARVKPGKEAELADAIEDGTLGRGSVAGGEYDRQRPHEQVQPHDELQRFAADREEPLDRQEPDEDQA